jgi:hypothetical protein
MCHVGHTAMCRQRHIWVPNLNFQKAHPCGGNTLAQSRQQVVFPQHRIFALFRQASLKLLGNLFELKDLGPKDLKGIAGPVRTWAALRASSAEGRFEALHAEAAIRVLLPARRTPPRILLT